MNELSDYPLVLDELSSSHLVEMPKMSFFSFQMFALSRCYTPPGYVETEVERKKRAILREKREREMERRITQEMKIMERMHWKEGEEEEEIKEIMFKLEIKAWPLSPEREHRTLENLLYPSVFDGRSFIVHHKHLLNSAHVGHCEDTSNCDGHVRNRSDMTELMNVRLRPHSDVHTSFTSKVVSL
ncbi:uncharacterized protein MONOS_3276 [Monocercomonoides exilis]|uniref:uncharacterized protein n=1 Tax=Monocercomonoides exilis TaxID=2049356 RepID=UPI00355AC200|nr:hypothetical protein MONOS_3276 [Monocercomonoides exilis]|eukprot:MONOS_3276.1-p1 / transcript=MONOS_3276.1 / gene=MONOS_3276 / organism=Monocercomonoides_exilis_PA203 / gene_product=unspecified product / transcript_product=unspecified product / location=Mono_scaffold00076:17187-17968(-) / protein_length=185 / sequence_SO=supercontig / SO=protein_coding / is_pseudo=false